MTREKLNKLLTILVQAWEIENNIIDAVYISTGGAKYSLIGSFYPFDGKVLGNWGFDNSATDGGLWEMTNKK